jgi:hypothetical protein
MMMRRSHALTCDVIAKFAIMVRFLVAHACLPQAGFSLFAFEVEGWKRQK